MDIEGVPVSVLTLWRDESFSARCPTYNAEQVLVTCRLQTPEGRESRFAISIPSSRWRDAAVRAKEACRKFVSDPMKLHVEHGGHDQTVQKIVLKAIDAEGLEALLKNSLLKIFMEAAATT